MKHQINPRIKGNHFLFNTGQTKANLKGIKSLLKTVPAPHSTTSHLWSTRASFNSSASHFSFNMWVILLWKRLHPVSLRALQNVFRCEIACRRGIGDIGSGFAHLQWNWPGCPSACRPDVHWRRYGVRFRVPNNSVLIWSSITATFFTPGLGACWRVNGPNDFIAAASHQMFDTFPYVLTSHPVYFKGLLLTYTVIPVVLLRTRTTTPSAESLWQQLVYSSHLLRENALIIYISFTQRTDIPSLSQLWIAAPVATAWATSISVRRLSKYLPPFLLGASTEWPMSSTTNVMSGSWNPCNVHHVKPSFGLLKLVYFGPKRF